MSALLVRPLQKAASAGDNEMYLTMQLGEILKEIAVQNVTKTWGKGSIILAAQPTTSIAAKRQIALVHENIQAGSKYVIWRGREIIQSPYLYVIGQLFNCDVDNELWLIVGYEPAPAPKRGWW